MPIHVKNAHGKQVEKSSTHFRVCEFCNQELKGTRELKTHFNKYHKKLKCLMCGDHFEGSVALKEHVIKCKEKHLSKLQKACDSKHSSQEIIEKVDLNELNERDVGQNDSGFNKTKETKEQETVDSKDSKDIEKPIEKVDDGKEMKIDPSEIETVGAKDLELKESNDDTFDMKCLFCDEIINDFDNHVSCQVKIEDSVDDDLALENVKEEIVEELTFENGHQILQDNTEHEYEVTKENLEQQLQQAVAKEEPLKDEPVDVVEDENSSLDDNQTDQMAIEPKPVKIPLLAKRSSLETDQDETYDELDDYDEGDFSVNVKVENIDEDDKNNLHNAIDFEDKSLIAFRCSECVEVFESLESLQKHMLESHEKTRETVKVEITNSIPERNQLNGINDDSPDLCQEVEIKAEPVENIESNEKDEDKKENLNFDGNENRPIFSKLKCEICDIPYATQAGLNGHFKANHEDLAIAYAKDPTKLKCDICESVFKHSRYLFRHKILVHQKSKDENDVFESNHDKIRIPGAFGKCEICHKIFSSKKRAKVHQIKYHANDNQGLAKNDASNENDKTEDDTLDFLKEENETKCYECGKILSSRKNLRRHKHDVHEPKENKVKNQFCDQCDYANDKAWKVKKHFREVHAKNPNAMIKCTHCDKSIHFKSIRRHVERVHEIIEKFECNKCDFTTFYKRELYVHDKLNHTEDTQCHICGQIVPQSQKRHKCGKTFGRKKVSNQEDLKKCYLCGLGVHVRSLKRHVENAHNIKVIHSDPKGEPNVISHKYLNQVTESAMLL